MKKIITIVIIMNILLGIVLIISFFSWEFFRKEGIACFGIVRKLDNERFDCIGQLYWDKERWYLKLEEDKLHLYRITTID